MKLIEQQKLLADLYTNGSSRENYFQQEKNALDKKEVAVFAEGLLHKRRNVVKGMMSLSFSYYNKLYDLFFEYAALHTMKGYHLKHQLDALSFLTFLENKTEIQQERYLSQILKYEKFVLKCSMRGNAQFFFSDYRIPLATEESIHKPATLKGKIVLVYYRFFVKSPWKRFILKW